MSETDHRLQIIRCAYHATNPTHITSPRWADGDTTPSGNRHSRASFATHAAWSRPSGWSSPAEWAVSLFRRPFGHLSLAQNLAPRAGLEPATNGLTVPPKRPSSPCAWCLVLSCPRISIGRGVWCCPVRLRTATYLATGSWALSPDRLHTVPYPAPIRPGGTRSTR